MGKVLGGDFLVCRKGIQAQGEGRWAGETPASSNGKQEVKHPLLIVTWALFSALLHLHGQRAGGQLLILDVPRKGPLQEIFQHKPNSVPSIPLFHFLKRFTVIEKMG